MLPTHMAGSDTAGLSRQSVVSLRAIAQTSPAGMVQSAHVAERREHVRRPTRPDALAERVPDQEPGLRSPKPRISSLRRARVQPIVRANSVWLRPAGIRNSSSSISPG